MPAPAESLLAQVVVAWQRRSQVTWAHIARVGGIKHWTLYAIRTGQTRQPKRSTLDGIARACATAMYEPRYLDRDRERRIRRELYRAAGYAPPGDGEPGARTSLLETGLADETGSPELARAWTAKIRSLPGLTADEIGRLQVGPEPADI